MKRKIPTAQATAEIQKEHGPVANGRPLKWWPREEFTNELCERLAQGTGLKTAIGEMQRLYGREHVPPEATIRWWIVELPTDHHRTFFARYERARAIGDEVSFDEIEDLAAELEGELRVLDEDNKCLANALVNARKMRLDARKWSLARRQPNRYGDSSTHKLVPGQDEEGGEVTWSVNVAGS